MHFTDTKLVYLHTFCVSFCLVLYAKIKRSFIHLDGFHLFVFSCFSRSIKKLCAVQGNFLEMLKNFPVLNP